MAPWWYLKQLDPIMRRRLTKQFISTARPEDREAIHWDTEVLGLGAVWDGDGLSQIQRRLHWPGGVREGCKARAMGGSVRFSVGLAAGRAAGG